MEDWRIYYDDDSVVTTIPDSKNRTGVIAVAEREQTHNWMFWFGKDWYLLQNDWHWMGVDQRGFEDQMNCRIEKFVCCLRGRTLVPFNKYQDVIDRMLRECKPNKTGWHPCEKLND